MLKLVSLLAVAALAGGCASIVNDTSHPMKLETRRADGTMVAGAACQLSNDYGTVRAVSAAP